MPALRHTPTLHELQRSVEHYLLDALPPLPDTASADFLYGHARPECEAEARLAVYRNTALASLASALGLSFPVVRQLVGTEFFAATAQLFIRAHPPESAYLNDYGSGFAQFLRDYPAAGLLDYLPEVAE